MEKAKILIVEDEILVAKGLEQQLRSFGYENVAYVLSGEKAVAAAAEMHPDLLLLDIRLKGDIDGINVAEIIHLQSRVPTLYLTAYEDEETLSRAKKTGPFGYLLKPVDQRELRITVAMALYRAHIDRELWELKERYQAVVTNLSEGVVLQEASGKIVTWNRRAEEIFGLKAEEVIGRTSLDYLWPTIREDGSPYPGEAHPSMVTLQTGAPVKNAIMGIQRTGTDTVWVSISTQPLFKEDEQGPYAVAISFDDITERKKLRDALRLTQFSVDTAAVSIFWISPEGKFLYVNEHTCRELGYTREELLSMSVHDVDPDFPAGRRPEHWAQLKTDKTITFESRHRRKDGSVFPVELTIHYLLFDDREYEFAFARNITESRQANEEHARLTTAIDQAGEAFVVTDADGTIQYVNPAFERITGYARDEVVGQTPRIVKSGRHDDQFYRNLWDTISSGCIWQGIFVNKKRDGSLYNEEATISPVKNAAGSVANYVAVKRDITHELMLEEQLRQTQKMEAVGTLSGGIAHDFNNILSGIINYTELAMDALPETTGPAKQYLDESLKLCILARDLIKRLMLFSRPSPQELKPLSLDPVIRDFLKLLRSTIPSTIDIHYTADKKTGMVMADPVQMHQILMNICSNAADAMARQGGTLEIQLAPADLAEAGAHGFPGLSPGAYVKLTISDTGAGIAPEILDRIFDPFFTTKEKAKGTGMGLAVVHSIIKMHKGYIAVSSAPGRGSVFTILLPALHLPAAAPGRKPVPDKSLPAGTEHILLVDDEKSIIVTMQLLLKSLGYTVTATQSSREALDLFREAPDRFDLLFTDQTMPDMTGHMLAKHILGLRPEIPVVLCTGYSDVMDDENIQTVGIRAFVIKPYEKHDIARVIRDVLDGRK